MIRSAARLLSRGTPSCPHELRAKALDGASWGDYLKAEDKLFAEVLHEVSQRLDADERIPINRYFEGSPVYPEGFAQDWNRSYELEPDGTARRSRGVFAWADGFSL